MDTPTDWVIVEIRQEDDPNIIDIDDSNTVISMSEVDESDMGVTDSSENEQYELSDDAGETPSDSYCTDYDESRDFDDGVSDSNEGGGGDFSSICDDDDDDDDGDDDLEELQVTSTQPRFESHTYFKITVLEQETITNDPNSAEYNTIETRRRQENIETDDFYDQRIGIYNQTVSENDALVDTLMTGELINKPFSLVHLATHDRQTEKGLCEVVDVPNSNACKSDSALSELSKHQHLHDKEQKHSVNEVVDVNKRATRRVHSGSMKDLLLSKTDIPGDTMEVHFNNVDSIIDGDAVFTGDTPSPECSTRFDFTPAARRSTNDGAATRSSGAQSSGYSGGHSAGYSAASGRRNPRAKVDSEVRSAVTPHGKAKQLGHWNGSLLWQPREIGFRKLDDIAQAKNNSAPRKSTQQKSRPDPLNLVTKLPLPAIQKPRVCSGRKPAIPHQLKSIACYQDGKVDVSILGDQRYLNQEDPVNVQITFVHRQPSPKINQVKEPAVAEIRKTNDVTKVQRARQRCGVHGIDTNLLGAKETNAAHALKGVLPPIRPKPKQKQRKLIAIDMVDDQLSGRMKSYDFHQIPAKTKAPFCRNHVLPPLQTKFINGKQMTIKKENPDLKAKWKLKKQKKRPFTHQNYDIVNCRAQWPPFNTHTDPEASKRHQKRITDLSVV